MRHLETTHHFCLKRIQNLPRSTRSDMVKGFTPVQTYVDMHKLLFLGSLCRLQPEYTCFKLFIHRLYQHRNVTTRLSKGFKTDIVFILLKYRLCHYLEEFTTISTFSCKPVCKYIRKDSVFKYEHYMWPQRINASSEFSLFCDIHNSLTV